MPKRPPRLSPPCNARAAAAAAASRGSAHQRGYDRTWRRVRLMHLAQFPLCELCEKQGQATPAAEVDHRRPMSAGGARFDSSNLRSLCKTHHSQVTANFRARGVNEIPT